MSKTITFKRVIFLTTSHVIQLTPLGKPKHPWFKSHTPNYQCIKKKEKKKVCFAFFTFALVYQSKNLFQYQCCLQTLSVISSIGTFLVSGSMKNAKSPMINTQAEKNRKMPYLRWHSIERKACAITKVKSMLTDTVTLCPIERVSSGNVSLGINHPRGPQDQAKDETKVQTITTTRIANPFERSLVLSFSLNPRTIAITTWERNIWTQASSKSIRRPILSTE